MKGVFIADLAAWTWVNAPEQFYPKLISKDAKLSDYAEDILAATEALSRDPNIEREAYFQRFCSNTSHSAGHRTMMQAIAVGWLFDSLSETYKMARKYCLNEDKEDWYASRFLAQLIFVLRHGATKSEALLVENISPFKNFVDNKEWHIGAGPLSCIVRAWNAFYRAFDYGSAIHNAVKLPGDVHFNCILVGALADAMYGSDYYYTKKKFNNGGIGCEFLGNQYDISDRLPKGIENKRVFFPKIMR